MVKLDKRLSVCASLTHGASCVADIGTDHAYIPIWLIQNEKCAHCVASDINEGPVQRAKRNVMLCGVADRIDVICAPGLESEAFDGCDNIIIAGMGGELIADILSATDRPKSAAKLILQPMSKQDCLRRYLWDNGYKITYDEPVCSDRLYQVICAKYVGENTRYKEMDAQIGMHSIISEDVKTLVRARIAALGKSAEGIALSGGYNSHIKKVIEELEELL